MKFLKSFNKTCKRYLKPLLCCIAAAILLWYLRPGISKFFREGFTGGREFVFHHMKGCPHCVNMMPEWSKFESSNDSGIKTRKTEQSEAPDEIKKHGIKGFPSLMLLDGNGNKIKDYQGPRTAAGFSSFCAENA